MFKDRYILLFITVTLIALQAALWPLVLKISDLPNEVALWYTQPPINRLAPTAYLWIIPGVAAACFAVNTIIAFFIYRRFSATAQLLVILSALIGILAAFSVINTILIYTTLL
jgi:hypothetical protein